MIAVVTRPKAIIPRTTHRPGTVENRSGWLSAVFIPANHLLNPREDFQPCPNRKAARRVCAGREPRSKGIRDRKVRDRKMIVPRNQRTVESCSRCATNEGLKRRGR